MANTYLVTDEITREALRVLHQKLNFVGNMTRDYDSSFAQNGAKIGNTLRIRNPNQFVTGSGATIATGTTIDQTETSTTLTVNSQKHVAIRFTSNERTMKMDDFSMRYIEPAMAVLAANVESDVFNLVNQVPATISAGTAVGMTDILSGNVKLAAGLTPPDNRYAVHSPQHVADLLTDTKGLFQDSTQIAKQYRDGMLGRVAGYEHYENTLIGNHTTGAEAGLSNYLTNQVAAQTGSSLIVDTGTKSIAIGDTFTIAGVYSVHPETKASTGDLQEFVALSALTGAGTMTISPSIVASGPNQNVSNGAANNQALTFSGAASTTYKQSLLFQKGFACFATADLVLPKGVADASRQVYDGISLRYVEDYDIVKDRFFGRIDILYGYKMLRPQLAAKVWST